MTIKNKIKVNLCLQLFSDFYMIVSASLFFAVLKLFVLVLCVFTFSL